MQRLTISQIRQNGGSFLFALCAVFFHFPVQAAPIHAVSDLSHAFSFYADGRFHKQYLPDEPVNSNWGALEKTELANANLIVLLDCTPLLGYTPEDCRVLDAFLNEGGSLVIAGTLGESPQHALIRRYGASFTGDAMGKLSIPGAAETVEGIGASLIFEKPEDWRKLIVDENGNAVAAWRRINGKGYVLVVSRGLIGQSSDGKDALNRGWWQRILKQITAAKTVDSAQPFAARSFMQSDCVVERHGVQFLCSLYLKPVAERLHQLYDRIIPATETILGVPVKLSCPMQIGLLPAVDAEFTAGKFRAISAFRDNFPAEEAGMMRKLTTLLLRDYFNADAEPWSDVVASYVSYSALAALGLPEGECQIAAWIDRAKEFDPEMKFYNLDGVAPPETAPVLEPRERVEIRRGKVFFILKELQKRNPEAIARYMKTKQAFSVENPKHKPYTVSDTVAFLSLALGEDLFPLFNAHGIAAVKSDAQVQVP